MRTPRRGFAKRRSPLLAAAAMVVAAATAVTAAPVLAADPQPRRVSKTYLAASFANPSLGPVAPLRGTCETARGCVWFVPKDGETYVSVAIGDRSGTSPLGYVFQDANGDGVSDTDDDAWFCGRMQRPLRISPGVKIRVFIFLWWPDCPSGVGTTGDVTATFLRR